MKHSETFHFYAHLADRSFQDDNWRATDAASIDAWKSAITLLKTRDVVMGDARYSLTMDWTPSLRLHERHYSAMSYLHKDGFKDLGRRLKSARFPKRPANIPIVVRSEAKNLGGIAESVLHDIFLIMNIAAPGSCNFYRAELIGSRAKTEGSLSNMNFELGILPSKSLKRPKIKFIPVDKVISWYDGVRVGAAQVPSSPTERAIFALLHLSKLDGEALSVIWFFYAIESLLQTKVGENFASIIRRLTLLLELTPNEVSDVRKQMRLLYNMRSAIVHGGFEVMHPMNNEVLDERTGRVFGNVI